jgi:hypothetical protein
LPTTQAERRDCEATLSHNALQQLSWSPKVLDFGKLFLEAEGEKHFNFTNYLEQSILVQVGPHLPEELKRSQPLSQMVPPGETAVFNMVFSSSREQHFKQTISVCVNGVHNYTFICQAEVAPIALEVSKSTINFAFSPENTGFTVLEATTITNPSNVEIDYWLTCPKSEYTLNPSKGKLGKFKSQRIEVTYEPKFSQKRLETEILLNVKGGPSQKITCVSQLADAACDFKSKTLEVGAVCVGIPMVRTVALKNMGKSRTVYRVLDCPPGVRVEPRSASVAPWETIELTVTITAPHPMVYKDHITLDIRGRPEKGKGAKLLLTGQAVLPDVEVLQEEVAFGETTLGSTHLTPLSIINRSEVTVTLELDLAQHADFKLVFPSEWDQFETPPVVLVQESISPRNGRRSMSMESAKGEKHLLTVAPESTLEVHLQYRPSQVLKHHFALPLALPGLPGHAGCIRVMTAQGMPPKVTVSRPDVDFEQQIVLKRERAITAPYTQRFELQNREKTELDWRLTLPALILGVNDDGTQHTPHEEDAVVWRVEPSMGTLKPGESVSVAVCFSPAFPIQYDFPLSLFLAGEAADTPYLEVNLHGCGTFPRLSFDVAELVLPVVPLGTKATASFRILNQGYDNLELRYSLPLDQSRLPLTLFFPEGSSLNQGTQSVLVEVTFLSSQPMAFQSKVTRLLWQFE